MSQPSNHFFIASRDKPRIAMKKRVVVPTGGKCNTSDTHSSREAFSPGLGKVPKIVPN